MRVGDQQAPDSVGLAHRHAGDATAAAALDAVGLQRQALDVAAVGQRDHRLLVRDQVFFAEVLDLLLDDLRAPLVAVALLDVLGLFDDQEVDLARVGQQVFEVVDLLDQLLVLVLELLALQRGQAAQLHVQHGLRLALATGRTAPACRRVRAASALARFADGADDRVELSKSP